MDEVVLREFELQQADDIAIQNYLSTFYLDDGLYNTKILQHFYFKSNFLPDATIDIAYRMDKTLEK